MKKEAAFSMVLPAGHKWVLLPLLLLAAPAWQGGEEKVDLGHGYVRRGAHIHFEGGGQTGPGVTRIDSPSEDTIAGFSRGLRRPMRACQSPDAATFEALSKEYARDKCKVFYKWISPGRFLVIELPEADVKSFRPLNLYHAVDRNTIWYTDSPIGGSDPGTVRVLADTVIKDARRVYVSGRAQKHLDAGTFRAVGSAYYIDANGVYWGSEKVDGADPATFRVLGDSFVAVDKNSVYRSGVRQPHLDAATCKFIFHDPYGYQLVSDKNGVYLNNLKILHADPNDFSMVDNRTGKGGKHVFLVDTYHCTPVTVYREKGQLVAETILYESQTRRSLAVIKGQVGADRIEKVTLSPAPGREDVGQIPDWQVDLFKRADLVGRMNEASEHLK